MAIGVWQLVLIAVIVLLLFGTKKLRNIGGDLGGAIRGFKDAMNKGEQETSEPPAADKPQIEQRESAAKDASFSESKDRSQP